MSEHVTAEQLRESARKRRDMSYLEQAAELERAAATIEALQARVAELEAVPSSADTDDARHDADVLHHMMTDDIRGYLPEHVRDTIDSCCGTINYLCYALDARRAECHGAVIQSAASAGCYEIEKQRREDAESECERLRALVVFLAAVADNDMLLAAMASSNKLAIDDERLRRSLGTLLHCNPPSEDDYTKIVEAVMALAQKWREDHDLYSELADAHCEYLRLRAAAQAVVDTDGGTNLASNAAMDTLRGVLGGNQ